MVRQDGAADSLLDTYEEERAPHVRTLVATAKEFGLIIGELDPEAARQRDEQLGGALERGEAETIRQRFVPDLASGVIDRAPDARGAGALFVQPRIRLPGGAEVLLDDLVGSRFLLVTTSAEAQAWLTPDSAGLWRRLRGERVVIRERSDEAGWVGDDIHVLIETEGLFTAWAKSQGRAALVRPDRYVYGVADDPATLNRLVADAHRQVFG